MWRYTDSLWLSSLSLNLDPAILAVEYPASEWQLVQVVTPNGLENGIASAALCA